MKRNRYVPVHQLLARRMKYDADYLDSRLCGVTEVIVQFFNGEEFLTVPRAQCKIEVAASPPRLIMRVTATPTAATYPTMMFN